MEHLEVLYHASQVGSQYKNITPKPKTSKNQGKVMRQKKKFVICYTEKRRNFSYSFRKVNLVPLKNNISIKIMYFFSYVLFYSIFSANVCLFVMSESERCAGRKLYHDFNLSQIELDLFLGAIHLSGYTQKRLY